jgi:hypothetical protein
MNQNDNSRPYFLIDISLYLNSPILTGRPAKWVTDKYSLSPRRERDRVRGSKFKKNIPKYTLRFISLKTKNR